MPNYITDANHLPEDGYFRPKHVGGVPYVYKLLSFNSCAVVGTICQPYVTQQNT